MNEIYICSEVAEERIKRIDTEKIYGYLKITATHVVDADIIQSVEKFEMKRPELKMWNQICTFLKNFANSRMMIL